MNAIARKPARTSTMVSLLWLPLLAAAGCGPAGPPIGPNAPPVADAGADQTVDTGASVTLDGSGSINGLSFSWKQLSGTPVSLSSTSGPTASFTAPSVGTTLAFELTVSNTKGQTTDVVNVSVHPVEQSAQVTEVRQRSVMDDPAVAGNFPDGWTPPGPTPGPPPEPDEIDEGGPAALDQIQFGPRTEVDLTPGASREVELPLTGPAILLGSVRWIGTVDPLPVTISLDGALLATGDDYSFAADRGGSYLTTQTTAGGQATLSVTNTSGTAVKVRMVFGSFGQ